MAIRPTRRNFLRAAPIAAAVSLSHPERLFAATQVATPETFHLFTAAELAHKEATLAAAPGNDNLLDPKSIPLAIVMTTEKTKSAKEFEWHEGRDHIVQILDGTTVYEVGGTPKGGHSSKPGEWNSPESQGATTYNLKKGDMLLIPRNTPHKRNTADSVTFLLISSSGMVM